jgi:hypothetical protein
VNGHGHHDDDRMLQFLADRATEGLARSDAGHLEAWLNVNSSVDADAFDQAAAAIALTGVPAYATRLPLWLRCRVLGEANAFFASGREA